MPAVSIIDFCRVALETLTVKMEFAIPNVILRKTMIARTISVILDRILFNLLSFLYDRVVLGDLLPPGPCLKNQGTTLFRPKLHRPASKMPGARKEFFLFQHNFISKIRRFLFFKQGLAFCFTEESKNFWIRYK
jgi:hypothetical protein